MKKKILSLALVICLLAIAIAGGTLAYFTDNDADVNTFVSGNVKIKQNEEQREYTIDEKTGRRDYNDSKIVAFDNKNADKHPLVPAVIPGDTCSYDGTVTLGNEKSYKIFDETVNNELDKFITVTNTGTEEAYIRTIVAFEDDAQGTITSKLHTLWGGEYEKETLKPNDKGEYVGMESGKFIYWLQNSDDSWLTVNINGTLYTIAVYTYKDYLKSGETSDPSLMQLWLDPSATNEWSEAVGGEYQILAASLAVQADGFNDPDISDPASKAMDTAFDLTKENLVTWLTATNKTQGASNAVSEN